MTRAVGIEAVRAYQAALQDIERASQRGQAAIDAGKVRVGLAVAVGKQGEALQIGAAVLADWQLEVITLGARYEQAAVALLGERRRSDETLEAYVLRTLAVAQDFHAMRAMQQANGVVYVGGL